MPLGDGDPQEELLGTVPHELDFIGPACGCDLDEMALDIQYKSKDLHYQLEDITGSLLEKALRGIIIIYSYPYSSSRSFSMELTVLATIMLE